MFITIIGWIVIIVAILLLIGGLSKNQDGSKPSKKEKTTITALAVVLVLFGGYMAGHHGRQVKADKAATSSSIAKSSSKRESRASSIAESKHESKVLAKASSDAESTEKENMKKPDNTKAQQKQAAASRENEHMNKIGYLLDKSSVKKKGWIYVSKDTTDLDATYSVNNDNRIIAVRINEVGDRDQMLDYFKEVTAGDLEPVNDTSEPDVYFSKSENKYYHVTDWEETKTESLYKSAQINEGKE